MKTKSIYSTSFLTLNIPDKTDNSKQMSVKPPKGTETHFMTLSWYAVIFAVGQNCKALSFATCNMNQTQAFSYRSRSNH